MKTKGQKSTKYLKLSEVLKMSFAPSRYWNLIKNATTEDEVWNLLDRKNLPNADANKVVQMFRTSMKVRVI